MLPLRPIVRVVASHSAPPACVRLEAASTANLAWRHDCPPPRATRVPRFITLHAHPLLAGLLGFIPGVGAMYNGQFVKALAHVLIFAVFVSLSDKSLIFGVAARRLGVLSGFDAAQTAKARRDGLPLPNPFGSERSRGAAWHFLCALPTYSAAFAPPRRLPAQCSSAPRSVQGKLPASTPAIRVLLPPPPGSDGAPRCRALCCAAGYQPPAAMEPQANRHPVGAVVLIVIGVVLLLQTLGVFEDQWIGAIMAADCHRRGRLAALPQNAGDPARRRAMNSWLLHPPPARAGLPDPGRHYRPAQPVGSA